jgi:hypothetical protein
MALLVATIVFTHTIDEADRFAAALGCEDRLLSRVDSPGRRYSAHVFIRECGATTADSIHANIQPYGVALNAEKHAPFVVLSASNNLRLQWQSANALTVEGVGVARVFKRESVPYGVQIAYQ